MTNSFNKEIKIDKSTHIILSLSHTNPVPFCLSHLLLHVTLKAPREVLVHNKIFTIIVDINFLYTEQQLYIKQKYYVQVPLHGTLKYKVRESLFLGQSSRMNLCYTLR